MKKQFLKDYNNAQKSVACLAGVLLCVNLLPAVAQISRGNPAVPAILSLAAQILFVMFVYFALVWIRKD